MLLVTFLLFVSSVSGLMLNSSVSGLNPDTVDSLDVPKYMGTWYQVAADQYVISSFEQDDYCVTALYGDNGDGTFSVRNYAKKGSPDGASDIIEGTYFYHIIKFMGFIHHHGFFNIFI